MLAPNHTSANPCTCKWAHVHKQSSSTKWLLGRQLECKNNNALVFAGKLIIHQTLYYPLQTFQETQQSNISVWNLKAHPYKTRRQGDSKKTPTRWRCWSHDDDDEADDDDHNSANTKVDALIWRYTGALLYDCLVGHSCVTLLWDSVVGHSCGTPLWDTIARHYCTSLMWDTVVWHSCKTLF